MSFGLKVAARGLDSLAAKLSAIVDAAAEPALTRYCEATKAKAEADWYTHVERRTGESGDLRIRVYRTSSGRLRAKIGTDAKYARFTQAKGGGRVLDKALTGLVRGTVRDGFLRELGKELT